MHITAAIVEFHSTRIVREVVDPAFQWGDAAGWAETAVVLLAAIIAWVQFRHYRRQAIEQGRPFLTADLDITSKPGLMMLRIRNSGKGVASNLTMTIVNQEVLTNDNCLILPLADFPKSMAYMPPNQEINYTYVDGKHLQESELDYAVDLEFAYDYAGTKNSFKEVVPLQPRNYARALVSVVDNNYERLMLREAKSIDRRLVTLIQDVTTFGESWKRFIDTPKPSVLSRTIKRLLGGRDSG